MNFCMLAGMAIIISNCVENQVYCCSHYAYTGFIQNVTHKEQK